MGTLIAYGIMAAVALGMVYGAYSYVDHSWETTAGIEQGKKLKQPEIDALHKDVKDRTG